jgi:hypothetical protein
VGGSRRSTTRMDVRPTCGSPAAASPIRRDGRGHQLLQVGGKGFHKYLSPFYDWDTPPFFKHFLRIDVDSQQVRVTCHAVTGGADSETCPPVEDHFVLPLPAPSIERAAGSVLT